MTSFQFDGWPISLTRASQASVPTAAMVGLKRLRVLQHLPRLCGLGGMDGMDGCWDSLYVYEHIYIFVFYIFSINFTIYFIMFMKGVVIGVTVRWHKSNNHA